MGRSVPRGAQKLPVRMSDHGPPGARLNKAGPSFIDPTPLRARAHHRFRACRGTGIRVVYFCDGDKDPSGRGACGSGRSPGGPCRGRGRAAAVGKHHAARAERVDLLDHFRQTGGDAEAACRAGLFRAQRGDPAAVLLARMLPSVIATTGVFDAPKGGTIPRNVLG